MNTTEENLFTQLRNKAGLSQRELAEETDLSPGYISELESQQKKNPSLKVIKKLEDVLGEDIRIFFLN